MPTRMVEHPQRRGRRPEDINLIIVGEYGHNFII